MIDEGVYFHRSYFLRTTSKWKVSPGIRSTSPAWSVRRCFLANPLSWMVPTYCVQLAVKTNNFKQHVYFQNPKICFLTPRRYNLMGQKMVGSESKGKEVSWCWVQTSLAIHKQELTGNWTEWSHGRKHAVCEVWKTDCSSPF